ncbi:D-amino-acid transaminase [Paracoccus saliphilus]|uniref:Probable branched-chain-amino-acid aminotransferase n=1 Tax=Paracoccus saliphilus TaxID=405559 RepID=A0AA45W0T0_9RHOB|nr:D-amino-acid transaminase [Paracoccus saliphilus]WCR03321.1 D-amino-acid transaminase [Paracoccus saliphilus]SIS51376.1 D-alanine transaminase [Paracoccus saliphilus]
MTRQIYVNGGYLAESEAVIPVMDRGFLFGDAIYEVTAMIGGQLIDNDLHLARLERSLAAIDIPMPLPLDGIRQVQAELIRRNGMSDGTIYLQVSRGTAERDFLPAAEIVPNFVAFTQPRNLRDTPAQRNGISVALMPDPRWDRRDIKTSMLLGQVLAKQAAHAQGFDDVWLHEDGQITEGASSTAFILTTEGTIVTRPNSHSTLPGCTRQAVLKLIEARGLRFEERAFTIAEAQEAEEAFLTSASSLVQPVVRIGERMIGDGRPGPATRHLQELYLQTAGIRVEPVE